MGKGKAKYYVVWLGREPGIYLTWAECEAQVKGVAGARYKSFPTMEAAQEAYRQGAPAIPKSAGSLAAPSARALSPDVIPDAYAVDAACSGNPGQMEYRGVDVKSGIQLFHFGPLFGTNNIGEFLAIVHAMALQTQQGTSYPIYSDSRNALLWIKAQKCRTKLERTPASREVFSIIERAENWLKTHRHSQFRLLKWQTGKWGEIPADFGRK